MYPVSDVSKHSGTTWLELFALYLLRGGCIAPEQVSQSTHIKPRFSMLFKLFIRHSKALHVYADIPSRQLLKTLSNRTRPLLAYGVTSFTPMIASCLAISNEVSDLLHHAMLSLNGHFQGQGSLPLKIRQGPFKYPKFTPWDHLHGDNWLADYAARHLSQLSGLGFQATVPRHARQAQSYLGQGTPFLINTSQQHNDSHSHASCSRSCLTDSGNNQQAATDSNMQDVANQMQLQEKATADFTVFCPRAPRRSKALAIGYTKPAAKLACSVLAAWGTRAPDFGTESAVCHGSLVWLTELLALGAWPNSDLDIAILTRRKIRPRIFGSAAAKGCVSTVPRMLPLPVPRSTHILSRGIRGAE